MRLTNEEILTQFPFWSNHPSGNIQQVRYGDIPDCQYTQESYNHYQLETDPYLLNILLANACIYSQHGAFDIYKTIAGDIYIHTETQQVLHDSINVPYRNKPITIHLNLMYGLKALSLLSLRGTGKVKGFCNKNGIGSPCNRLNTEEYHQVSLKQSYGRLWLWSAKVHASSKRTLCRRSIQHHHE